MDNLLHQIKKGSKWEGKDSFPSNTTWENEVVKWLKFISRQGQYKQYFSRLQDKPEKRDEAFAEIAAAYYMSNYLPNCRITEWAPNNNRTRRGDFLIVADKGEIFCEVKSPSWKSAIVNEEGHRSARLNESKLLSTPEVRSYDNSIDVRKAIRKSYDQLCNDVPNLLMIVDNLFASNKDDNYFGVRKALFNERIKSPPYVFDIHYSWLICFGKKQDRYWKLLIENGYINEYADSRGRISYKFTGDRSDFSIKGINNQDIDQLFSILETVNPNGYFSGKRYAKLSALACLNMAKYLTDNEITYHWKLFENPYASMPLKSNLIGGNREVCSPVSQPNT